MENRTKENIILALKILISLLLCILLFLQNRKIEKLAELIITQRGFDPYEIHFYDRGSLSNNFILMERNMNRRFAEFAKEMEYMRYMIGDIFEGNHLKQEDYEEKLEKFREKLRLKKKANDGFIDRINEKVKDSVENEKTNAQVNGDASKPGDTTGRKNKNSRTASSNLFSVKTKHNKKAKKYEVFLTMPRDFTLDDVNVKLNKSILTISIQKGQQLKNDEAEIDMYNSFYQSFSIPQTKATLKDVNMKLDDGQLLIEIPIK